MFSHHSAPNIPGGAVGVLLLTALSLASFFPLIVLVEYVALQLLGWGKFRACLKAAFRMNLISYVVSILLMLFVPQPTTWQLLLNLALTIGIETGVLNLLKRNAWKSNLKAAIIANVASYIIWILPAFRFAQR